VKRKTGVNQTALLSFGIPHQIPGGETEIRGRLTSKAPFNGVRDGVPQLPSSGLSCLLDHSPQPSLQVLCPLSSHRLLTLFRDLPLHVEHFLPR
jgi:hypothetical protein